MPDAGRCATPPDLAAGICAGRAAGDPQDARDKHDQRRAFAVAASLDGLWKWDLASNTVEYSDRFLELLGNTPGEVPATLDFF